MQSFQTSLLWRCGHRCSCRILAVEVVDESTRDIERVSGINQRHLTTIDDHVDVVRLGINFQRLADVVLKWREDFLATAVVSSLGVFTLALKIFLHLIHLILDRKSTRLNSSHVSES